MMWLNTDTGICKYTMIVFGFFHDQETAGIKLKCFLPLKCSVGKVGGMYFI